MKKFAVLLITLFTALLCVNAATYTIKKDGGIQNPNGRIQRRADTNTTQYSVNQNSVNKYSDNNDVIYTKAQEPETRQQSGIRDKILNRTEISPNVDKEKAQNEKYLQKPVPNISIVNIVSKYSRDPNAANNRQAVLNNKKTANGCIITTFSNKPMYCVSCDSYYGYYYESVNNPILIAFDFYEYMNTNTYISYKYVKTKNNKWELKAKLIGYNSFPKKQFTYEKINNSYVLNSYYVGDRNYTPDGKLNHTRYVRQE